MANGKDILNIDQTNIGLNQLKKEDSYKQGLKKFGTKIQTKEEHLGRLRLHFPKASNEEEVNIDAEEETGVEREM
ncbi:hypothetical protein PGT21_021034 [Puccinia graminis f. sp. tritici]|uniref:Uncharacterized protein n=1 Tax=Puccinia graminis f. sp. tritici TaxID=56615 RepID=A0A5B0RIG8_PUCGR|nr:hypothetical protein PGT21_021034 [Puccinia graminis f. sp. tritici]KAA1125781.1 hypothetical protein PGTUg99_019469 [Puccinia graminis f. sp. tritici]